ncbi:hypothetical protein SAMN05443634_1057 [Chishuiella changwenlii]|jgi:hypothetical protein|uniref:Uncharacterized protein n=1 Tax=Chishuiella changwenlii TaxID=1434701 RepID=A0A1M6WVM3_9FLAO|nr:hypothetical protein [Chishuiella changwenlii]GGE98972.1 hypothetical protein GCM10010984_15690 [Chishuiella changwenlii]SHK97787.1 hypothetical protein SAMN05443634_1057 [Chishuiella changwenlii]
MDKYSFEIFIPAKPKRDTMKFVKVVLSFLAVSVISFVMLELEIFKNKTYYYIFVGVLATLVAYLNGYFKKPTNDLKGGFDGKLTFSNDGIAINNDFYSVKDLYSILIDNDDYKGKKIKEFGEFDHPEGSNGVDNLLTLKTKANKFIEVYFLQKTSTEFNKIESILINYYKQNLLTEEDLVSILKYKSDSDKMELNRKLR